MSKIEGEWEINNNVSVKHPTTKCPYGGLCAYPFCENGLQCTTLEFIMTEDQDNKVNPVGSVKQYFVYQENLNNLKKKISKLENAQKGIYKNIKTDITSILLGYGFSDSDFEVQLTSDGIGISLFVKIFNDYQIVAGIPTSLFSNLDDLMGIPGKINIQGKKKIAGNQVYTLDIHYEL